MITYLLQFSAWGHFCSVVQGGGAQEVSVTGLRRQRSEVDTVDEAEIYSAKEKGNQKSAWGLL